MAPSERKGHRALKIVLVVSLLLNVGFFYWTMTLGSQVNSLVRENQKSATDLGGIKQQNEILQNQLAYYQAQADYYSKFFNTGSTQAGLVGKSSVNMVAVEQVEQGMFAISYKGVVMNLLVELRNGQGRLLVNTQPKVGIDLQTSGRTAVLVAQNVTRVSMSTTDVILTVTAESNVEVVDGPSAGAAMTLAMIAAIRNQTLRKDVFISGTISPDQTIGPVGGLEYKAVAAAEKGATMFLVPKGQSVVTIYKPVEKQPIPGFTIVVYETAKVSLDSLLKERGYRVTVVEVTTVQEAYLAFTK
jgi:predicted S18 family serine protease